jgi:hypothetical protein
MRDECGVPRVSTELDSVVSHDCTSEMTTLVLGILHEVMFSSCVSRSDVSSRAQTLTAMLRQ